ncbi:hypothetical protein WICPIJ_007970 [Wickerhamomyces pijperi]|uniref:Uncharacterized protein n=1 Tax=Wickerhamomyces pijperi TaxID=599730 RepID=A0A9P8PZ86_WICPI|nr:hypothetical protein WICPIJ_007970 [Wickerhamomyces pijperi]
MAKKDKSAAKSEKSEPQSAATTETKQSTKTKKSNNTKKQAKVQQQQNPEPIQPCVKSPEHTLFADTLTYNVLQRHDPQLERLLKYCSHSQLYKLNSEGEWDKLDFSGVLAIYTRKPTEAAPYEGGMMILNRNSPENWCIGLTRNREAKERIECEVGVDFLHLKLGNEGVYNFWCYEGEEDLKILYHWVMSFVDPEKIQALENETGNGADLQNEAIAV